MFKNIELGRIHPHPNNPRRDLGDLTELSESIKVQGIRQNLTIVPKDPEDYERKVNGKKSYTGDFTVIIGHRRTAAAKLAGLTDAPCAIVLMDEKEQMATMLSENMLREDLTVLEQAQGMQLMLDFGETVKSISKKTGMSETTVRRRVKIVQSFDNDALEQVQDRDFTIDDYDKLYEISDADLRNKALGSIGTNNFEWEVRQAKSSAKLAEDKATILEYLAANATEMPRDDYGKSKIADRYTFWQYAEHTLEKIEQFIAAAESEVFYTAPKEAGSHGVDMTVYTIGEADPAEDIAKREAAEREEKREAVKKRMNALFRQAYEMRLSFAKKYMENDKTKRALNDMITYTMFNETEMNEAVFRDFFEIKAKFRNHWQEGEGETFEEAIERVLNEYKGYTVSFPFAGAYFRMEDDDATHIDWRGNYEPDDALNKIYEHLRALGYAMSDEEQKLMDGTHSIYGEIPK